MNRLSSRDATRILALAAAYAVTAAIGLRLGATLHNTPPLWPAAGVALAALCIGGIRLWPGVALGTLAIIAPRGNGALLTAAITVATTVEAVIGAWLLRRVFAFRPDLRRARDASALVIAGGVAAPAIGAAIGAGAFAASGALHAPLINEWFAWYLGDAMGALLFAPAVLAWLARDTAAPDPRRQPLEVLSFVVGLTAATFAALGGLGLIVREDPPVIFISFPFIVWGALRLGHRTTMGALAVVALAASTAASAHVGVFAGSATDVGALLQAYLATAAATALIVASFAAERRDANARLAESERRLSLVHEATTDQLALFAIDPAGVARLTFANSAYVTALRTCEPSITETDVIGASTSAIADRLGVEPTAMSFYHEKFAEVVRTGASVHLTEHSAIDGVPDNTVLSPVRGDDGRVTHVLWKAHDVADRLRAEAALRESEARLSLVFNSSSDTLLLFSVEAEDQYRLVMANRALRDVLHQHRPERAGREIAGLMMSEFVTDVLGLPSDRIAKNNELFRHVIESTVPFTYENRDWHGSDLVSEVTLVPVFDSTGRCTHILRSSRDITTRRAAEDSLRLHGFMMTHAPLGVLMLDGAHRIIFANEAACQLLASSRDDLLHSRATELDAPGLPSQWASLLADAKQRGRVSAEIERAAPDGSRHPLELTIACLDYAGQEIACVFVRDVEERRRAETTRRTLEAELFHAQKMEAIGTLAGGIAHDFNNILAAIVGNAEMAQNDPALGAAVRQDIDEVLRATRRARDLVRQILTFSRKQDAERRPVRVAEVIEDVTRLIRATIPSTIELRSVIDDADATILGDSTQLHQVLMNLCTNAAHAVGDAHGTISLGQALDTIDPGALRGDLLPGRYVCVSVSDTGHGMDRATMERVFEPFFTTKEPGVGTGLGLAVVHGIVRNHDGVALVESEPGAGTTFRLYFPLLAPVAAPSDGETGDVPRGAGERVLFVDDEPALAAVTSRILERLGYSVLALRSATEALSVFRANPSAFDLVISDLTMPGLTGAQLTVEMRRLRANVPVILSTGYLDRLDGATASSLQVRELLMKPYTTEMLATAVQRALRDTAA
jgi:PAS domain S-box-containing protein